MGLESGSKEGLSVLNKRLGVAQNLNAVETLRSIGVMFQYSFMLFDPSSTFNSIRENIAFLRRITADGSVAATFCRMLPYDGTAIKTELQQSGRFKGDVINPDYDFLDPRLDGLFREITETVNIVGWIHGIRSLSPELNSVWHEIAIIERLFAGVSGLDFYKEKLSAITNQANGLLFDLVEDMANAHEYGRKAVYDIKDLEFGCQELLNRLLTSRDEFVYRNQEKMLEVLGINDYQPEPVHAF
ncbi:MAG TPA: hypothetical protein VGO50_12885 [Pyrinomonadaceae bacterium]|jgi:hypothetical protein|nr:hypothetical protein [Pyrinomonadaceae bacterium]